MKLIIVVVIAVILLVEVLTTLHGANPGDNFW